MADDIDAIIAKLGTPLLRDLAAIAGFCDCMPDGKWGLITPPQRRHYQPGGESWPVVATGCVILGNSRVALHKRRMMHLRMGQVGRHVLRRCAAMRMDLSAPETETPDHG